MYAPARTLRIGQTMAHLRLCVRSLVTPKEGVGDRNISTVCTTGMGP